MAIMQQKLVSLITRQRFAQLLQSPRSGRMFSCVEVNKPSRSNLQRYKYIKHTKGGGHGSEEIASYDCLGVIFQEGGPTLVSRSTAPGRLLEVFTNGPWREPNLQLR